LEVAGRLHGGCRGTAPSTFAGVSRAGATGTRTGDLPRQSPANAYLLGMGGTWQCANHLTFSSGSLTLT
jgi:hypothetical protein